MDSGEPREVSDDPFFGEVRRRHPDVDIVLVPPEAAAPPVPPPVDPAVLAAAPVERDADTRDLWSQVARAIDPAQATARWAAGAVTGTVPLARAVTSALAVKLSWPCSGGTSIGLMLSRWRLSEVKTSRTLTTLAEPSGLAPRLLRMVIGKTTPSWATVLTLALLRISTPPSTTASSAPC